MPLYQHKQLAKGRWFKLTLVERMAHIGSEVERALSWQDKDRNYSQMAFERALELLDLTLADPRLGAGLKEISRLREIVCDYFFGDNNYHSDPASLRKYFYPFFYAARKGIL